jgi:hypothetical protein
VKYQFSFIMTLSISWLSACGLDMQPEMEQSESDPVTTEDIGTAAYGNKFCPASFIGVSGEAKMIIGAAGYTRSDAIAIAQDYCRTAGSLFFPDTTAVLNGVGNVCDQIAVSDHGPWLETAGIIGALAPRDESGNVYPNAVLDKQSLARLIVVSALRRNGLPSNPGPQNFRRAVELATLAVAANPNVFADADQAMPANRLWVKAIGALRMADGANGSFGVNTWMPKGAIAKLALRAMDINPSNANPQYPANIGDWFIDTSAAIADWPWYVNYYGFRGFADGIPPWSTCPGNAPRITTPLDIGSRTLSMRRFYVQAKSFINAVSILEPPPLGGIPQLFVALVGATNAFYNEDPPDGSLGSGDFRLFGEFLASMTCEANRAVDVDLTRPNVAAGLEGPFAGVINPMQTRIRPVMSGSTRIGFNISFVMSGRPNAVAEIPIEAVKPRTNLSIFQKGRVLLICRLGTPTATAFTGGSPFPSHRTWVTDLSNGATTPAGLAQDLMATLWSLPPVPAP